MKKQTTELWINRAAIVFLGLLVLGSIALAASGNFSWSRVEDKVAGIIGGKIDVVVDEPVIGAIPGDEVPGPDWIVGGVKYSYVTVSMNQATTTICTMKVPDNATSTLEDFSFTITKGTSTASILSVATSSKPYATSSYWSFGSVGIPANVGLSWAATSTPMYGAPPTTNNRIWLAPGDHVLLMVSKGLAEEGQYTYIGKCQAVFKRF